MEDKLKNNEEDIFEGKTQQNDLLDSLMSQCEIGSQRLKSLIEESLYVYKT